MTQIEKKEIILKNAYKILSHIEEKKYPRWTEFINRKIKTYLSSLYNSYILKDYDLAKELTKSVIELELIREYPFLPFGMNELHLEEIIEDCNFKYSQNVYISSDSEKIFGICEVEYANKTFGSIASHFVPDWSKYNETVATHYSKVITKSDVISLVYGSMFFAGFDKIEIQNVLYKYFEYKGRLPDLYKLKYVAILWGSIDPNERATLSIPSSKMGQNELMGNYHIYFHRISTSDVEIHNDNEFTEEGYSNFSEIYSEGFPNNSPSLYLIDDYYAIFA